MQFHFLWCLGQVTHEIIKSNVTSMTPIAFLNNELVYLQTCTKWKHCKFLRTCGIVCKGSTVIMTKNKKSTPTRKSTLDPAREHVPATTIPSFAKSSIWCRWGKWGERRPTLGYRSSRGRWRAGAEAGTSRRKWMQRSKRRHTPEAAALR